MKKKIGAPRSRMLSVWHLLGKANNKPLRLGIALGPHSVRVRGVDRGCRWTS
jgi:hypothetical protein